MKRAFNNLVSVGYSAIRILLYKIFNGKNFDAGFIERISPDVVLEFNKGSNGLKEGIA